MLTCGTPTEYQNPFETDRHSIPSTKTMAPRMLLAIAAAVLLFATTLLVIAPQIQQTPLPRLFGIKNEPEREPPETINC